MLLLCRESGRYGYNGDERDYNNENGSGKVILHSHDQSLLSAVYTGFGDERGACAETGIRLLLLKSHLIAMREDEKT
jgi:hypothetical protein